MERKYTTLKNNTITKLTENTYLHEEKVTEGSLEIKIHFLADKNGKAFGLITNNYFDYYDDATFLNKLGIAIYKKNLLLRILEDLKRKQEKNDSVLEAFIR